MGDWEDEVMTVLDHRDGMGTVAQIGEGMSQFLSLYPSMENVIDAVLALETAGKVQATTAPGKGIGPDTLVCRTRKPGL